MGTRVAEAAAQTCLQPDCWFSRDNKLLVGTFFLIGFNSCTYLSLRLSVSHSPILCSFVAMLVIPVLLHSTSGNGVRRTLSNQSHCVTFKALIISSCSSGRTLLLSLHQFLFSSTQPQREYAHYDSIFLRRHISLHISLSTRFVSSHILQFPFMPTSLITLRNTTRILFLHTI